MATITQGTSAPVVLAAGDFISLKNGPNDKARIEYPGGIVHKEGAAGRGIYGPFAAGSHKISAVSGSVTYLTGSITTVTPLGRM